MDPRGSKRRRASVWQSFHVIAAEAGLRSVEDFLAPTRSAEVSIQYEKIVDSHHLKDFGILTARHWAAIRSAGAGIARFLRSSNDSELSGLGSP